MKFTDGGRTSQGESSRYVTNDECDGCRTIQAVTSFNGSPKMHLCWTCELEEWTRIANNPHATDIYRQHARNNARRMRRGQDPK